MMLNHVFPKIFSRYTPLLDGRASILEAARVLTALQVSAVIVLNKSAVKDRVQYKTLIGYSILSKLPTKRGMFSRFLASRSWDIAQKVRVVKENDTIESVVGAIQESHLGIVLVSGKSGPSQVLTTVELRDFVRLYRDAGNMPKTKLKIGNLASSPVLSLKNGSALQDMLKTMLKCRVRKIFLPGTKSLVSDRDILSYITSPRIIERMNDSPETVFKTPASELPSSRPPVVDSKMSITQAVQLMNPDTGDCLICDRGLVTFWDIVIKLELSRKRTGLLLQGLVDAEDRDALAGVDISGREKRPELEQAEKKEMSESERKQFSAIGEKIRAQGFIAFLGVPRFARRRIVDPLCFEPPARPFRIIGINSGHKGGRKFTSINLFGSRVIRESYYVLDWEKFSKFISMKLEVMFRATNPDPPKQLKRAFTHFMHNFGLHWTGCHHAGRAEELVIRNVMPQRRKELHHQIM